MGWGRVGGSVWVVAVLELLCLWQLQMYWYPLAWISRGWEVLF